MMLEDLARAQRRTKGIMWMGSLFSFAMFPVIAFAGDLVTDLFGKMAAGAVLLSLPVVLGALIAFLGMTMTDPRRNVMEWGCKRPSKCLGYGMLPYILCLVFPSMLLLMMAMGLLAWGLMVFGGLVTAEIINRSMPKSF